MTSLILISPGIRNIDQLERSIKVPKITVSGLHIQDDLPEQIPVPDIPVPDMPGPDIPDQDISIPLSRKIQNSIIDLLDSKPSTLALLYENSYQQDLLDGLEDLLRILPSNTKTIDLLTCNINKSNVIEQIKSFEKTYNVTIRYSVDLTGHQDSMGNWVLESHNVSVRDKYFNNIITQWKHVLNTLVFSNDTERYQWYINNVTTIPPLPDPEGMSGTEMTSAINSITSLTVKSGLTTQLPQYLIKQNATLESITIEDQSTPYTLPQFWLRSMTVGTITFGNGFLGNSGDSSILRVNATKIIIKDQTQSYNINSYAFESSTIDELIFGYGLSSLKYRSIIRSTVNTVTIKDQQSYNIDGYAFNSSTINKIFFGKGLNVVGDRLDWYTSMPSNIVLPNTVTSVSSNVDPSASIRLISLANVSNVEVNLTVYENNRNLRNINFSGHDLSGIKLSGADLTDANLTNVNLDNTDLTNIVYGGLIGPYTGTPIHNRVADIFDDEHYLIPNGIEYQMINGTNQNLLYFPGISLNGVDLSGMNLSNVNLSGIITGPLTGYANVTLPSGYIVVSGTSESWIVGPGVDLSGANLSGADLSGAKTWPLLGTEPTLPSGYVFVQGTNESGIVGPDVDLSGVDLSGVDLSGAKTWPLLGTEPTLPSGYVFASGTNESGIVGPNVDLSGANLSGADLSGADLSGANLSSADLSGANLSGADLSGAKSWPLLGTEPTCIWLCICTRY